MPDTTEQTAAQQQLRDAVQRTLKATGQETGLLTDIVVIAAQQGIRDNGDEYTSIAYLTAGPMPHYRVLGLLDSALTRIRNVINGAH